MAAASMQQSGATFRTDYTATQWFGTATECHLPHLCTVPGKGSITVIGFVWLLPCTSWFLLIWFAHALLYMVQVFAMVARLSLICSAAGWHWLVEAHLLPPMNGFELIHFWQVGVCCATCSVRALEWVRIKLAGAKAGLRDICRLLAACIRAIIYNGEKYNGLCDFEYGGQHGIYSGLVRVGPGLCYTCS